MKERLIVDLDDVLCNTQPRLVKFVNVKTGLNLSVAKITRQMRESNEEKVDAAAQEFLRNPTLVLACPPFKRALDGIRILKGTGAEIHIVSSRKENLHQSTQEWLEKYGFNPFIDEIRRRNSELRGHEFKLFVAKNIGSKYAFDDTASVIENLAQNGVFVYVIDRPWNRDLVVEENFRRFNSFLQASLDYQKTHG